MVNAGGGGANYSPTKKQIKNAAGGRGRGVGGRVPGQRKTRNVVTNVNIPGMKIRGKAPKGTIGGNTKGFAGGPAILRGNARGKKAAKPPKNPVPVGRKKAPKRTTGPAAALRGGTQARATGAAGAGRRRRGRK